MKEERKRLVDALESKGDSEATAIRSAAKNNAEKIEAFAKAYAEEIRREGDLEAQQYVSKMNENPELAVFLKQVQFLKDLAASRITAVLNPQVPGMGMAPPRIGSDGKISSVQPLMSPDVANRATAEQREPSPQAPAVKPVSGQSPGAPR